MAHSTVLGIHDLVVHDYGPGRCDDLPPRGGARLTGTCMDMHDVIDNIEKELRGAAALSRQ